MRRLHFVRARGVLCAGALAMLWAGAASAHKGSDAYLDVQQLAPAAVTAEPAPPIAVRALRFTLSVAIKDLDLLLPMDSNSDGRVTWGEIRLAVPAVLAQANQSAALDNPTAAPSYCALRWQFDGVERRGDGAYLRLVAGARCALAQPLALRYTFFREQDANHRLLVAGHLDRKDLLTTGSPLRSGPLPLLAAPLPVPVAAGDARPIPAAADASAGRWSAVRDYFLLGVHHLLEGYDHLAFLLALVLPLRLALFATAAPGAAPAEPGRLPQPGKAVWWSLLRTVTAFTVGHSLTLMLATFGWTQTSPRWVEPAIAVSIAVAAALNLRPVTWVRTDVLALLFGMVHGIGFAGLLQEAAAPSGLLPWALAGFNLGVEAGQLLAVGAWVALVQPVVFRRWYPQFVVRGGSAVLMLLAAWWFWQRIQ